MASISLDLTEQGSHFRGESAVWRYRKEDETDYGDKVNLVVRSGATTLTLQMDKHQRNALIAVLTTDMDEAIAKKQREWEAKQREEEAKSIA